MKPCPVAPRHTKFKANTRHKRASSGEGLGLGQAARGTNPGAPACHTKGKRQQPLPSTAPGKIALRLKGGGLVWEVEHAGPTRCVKTGPARSTLQRRGVADTQSPLMGKADPPQGTTPLPCPQGRRGSPTACRGRGSEHGARGAGAPSASVLPPRQPDPPLSTVTRAPGPRSHPWACGPLQAPGPPLLPAAPPPPAAKPVRGPLPRLSRLSAGPHAGDSIQGSAQCHLVREQGTRVLKTITLYHSTPFFSK